MTFLTITPRTRPASEFHSTRSPRLKFFAIRTPFEQRSGRTGRNRASRGESRERSARLLHLSDRSPVSRLDRLHDEYATTCLRDYISPYSTTTLRILAGIDL